MWSGLSSKEKNLIVVCVITSVLAVAFLVSTIVIASNRDSTYGSSVDICKTDDCINTAYYLRLNIDERHKPCEDFHAFACGKFPVGHHGYRSLLGEAYEVMNERVLSILENTVPVLDTNSKETLDGVIELYRQCIEQEKKEEEGMDIVKEMLGEVFPGNLPMVVGDAWNESTFDWSFSIAKVLRGWDQNFFLPFNVLPSWLNSSRYSIQLLVSNAAEDNILMSVYAERELINKTICTVYSDCSADSSVQNDLVQLKSVLDMFYPGKKDEESSEARTFLEEKGSGTWPGLRADPESKNEILEYSIGAVQEEIPEVNWTAFFQIVLNDNTINDTFKINTYMKGLKLSVKLLQSFGNRTLANLLGWSFIGTWGRLFSPQLRRSLTPKITQQNVCYSYLNQVVGYALGKMYTDQHVPMQTIKQIEDMTKEIRKSFRELLIEADWMDKPTREGAFRKVDKLRSSVGSPPWTLDTKKFNDYYKEIKNIKKMEFRNSFRLMKKHYFDKQVERLSRTVDVENDWLSSTPLVANAAYYPRTNFMLYYPGIFAHPFYNPAATRAVRFGSFGFAAGHEVTHAFDSQGKNLDENGAENSWWSPEAENHFAEKAECFVECYSNITDSETNLRLNGTRTLAENIADSGGLRAAFKAYRMSDDGRAGRLKGLEDYTEDQLFFIAAAQSWCSNGSKESFAKSILTGNHSPAKYRATVPFQNDEDFSRAFNCDRGSRMNPVHKCKIW